MKEQIEEILAYIRPRLALHRGNVELVDIDEKTGIVRVKMTGACKGCPLSEVTLKHGIEAMILENIPEVREVIAVE